MEQVDLERITRHYTKLSDIELIAAFEEGAKSYADPEVWKIIVAEYVRRRIVTTSPAVSLYDKRDRTHSAE